MICHSSSVLFVSIFFIVCSYRGLTKELKILILSRYMIYKCPTDEYLVIGDWEKFRALNLSCPNQPDLSDLSLDLFDPGTKYDHCNQENRSFLYSMNVTLRSSSKHQISNITDEQMQLLSSTVFLENNTYQFTPTRIDNSERVLLYEIPIKWASNRQQTWYMFFQEQPIACVLHLNYTALIVNETCVSTTIKYFFICYHDPSSVTPLKNINWTFIDDLVLDDKYLPKNWLKKGAILYNARPETTTMTLTTTDSTSSSSDDITSVPSTVTTSPMDSTSGSSTDAVTTSHMDSTSSSSAEVTSMLSTDETPIPSTITTTALNTDLTSTSTIDTTAISSTDMISITSTDATTIPSTDSTTVTIATITTITRSTKIKKVTVPKPQKPQTPSQKPHKIKPAQNHSKFSGKPTGEKKPSSPPLLFIFLLVAFICAIAGLGVFFITRHLKKHHSNDDEEDPDLLHRVNSDESNHSEMDESETSTVMEAPPQSSTDQVQPKTAGRMVNRFDPDNM